MSSIQSKCTLFPMIWDKIISVARSFTEHSCVAARDDVPVCGTFLLPQQDKFAGRASVRDAVFQLEKPQVYILMTSPYFGPHNQSAV